MDYDNEMEMTSDHKNNNNKGKEQLMMNDRHIHQKAQIVLNTRNKPLNLDNLIHRTNNY